MKRKFTPRITSKRSSSKILKERGSVLPLVLIVMILAVVPILALYTFNGRELETAARYRDHEACLVFLDSAMAQCQAQIEADGAYTGETLRQDQGRAEIQVNRLNSESWFFRCTAVYGTAKDTKSGTFTMKNGRLVRAAP
ncbi:MAG: hypothetical protein ACI39G_03005 [Pseudoramibacter sp.]